MNNKKLMIAAVALVLVVGLMLGLFLFTRPDTTEGVKSFTVTVVHADGSTKDFVYKTSAEYLDEALLAEKLINGYDDQYGFVVEEVDGEAAVWSKDNASWMIYIDGESATVGISQIPVQDGAHYTLKYEKF